MFDPLANFKLNKIKKAVEALPTNLSSSFAEVKNAISGVSTKVDGVSTDLTSVIDSDVLKHGVVKSVQRGTLTVTDVKAEAGSTKDISISTINPQKAVAFVTSSFSGHGSEVLSEVDLISVTATNLKVKVRHSETSQNNVSVSWQVIEFY